MRILLVLMTLAIIMETVFYAYPFTLLIIMVTILSLGGSSLIPVFTAGLVLDIVGLKTLGVNSLVFLLVAAVMLRYNRRFNFNNLINVLIFITAVATLYSYFYYQKIFDPVNLLITVILSLPLLNLSQVIVPTITGKKTLKV